MPTSASTGTKHVKAAGASDKEQAKAQAEAAELEQRAHDAEVEAAQAREDAERAQRDAVANPQGVDLEEARPVQRSDFVAKGDKAERGKTFDDDVHRTRVRGLSDGTSVTEVNRFGSDEWEVVDEVQVYPKAVFPLDPEDVNPPIPDDGSTYA